MKIIVDGCDFTGKTTLINQLLQHYNSSKLSYLHFSYRDRRDYNFYNTMLDKVDFIADRHFLDELIYPKVFNRLPGFTDFEFAELMEKCKDQDIKIIILTCSNEELLKRSKTRHGEEPEVLRNLIDINEKFIKLANMCDLHLFDTTINSLDEIISYIEGELKHERYKSDLHK